MFMIDFDNNELSEVGKEACKDLVKPVAQESGGLLSLIPRAIRASLSGVEKWILNKEYSVKETQKLLEIKLANVSPEKIEAPEAYIAVPVINSLSYTFASDVLLNMYANLLATSMIKDSKWEVHPSFVEIIKQLSPDEAKLLLKLSKHSGENEFPLISLGMRKNTENPHSFLSEHYIKINNFSNIGDDVCERPNKIMTYIDNLARLQLIEIVDDESVSDFDYDPLINHETIDNYKTNNKVYDGFDWEIKQYMFKITQLGFDFIDLCVAGNKIR